MDIIYWLSLVLKIFIGFTIVIGYFFLTGKNQLSKMTPIDFVGNFIIGGVIGGVLYTTDIPIVKYISVLIISICIIYLISYLSSKFSKAREVTIGKSIILIKQNRFDYKTLDENNAKLDIVDILSKLHLKGFNGFKDVGYLQLEPNGDIIVLKEDNITPSSIVFRNGNWVLDSLERNELEQTKLEDKIKSIKLEDILFIEYDSGYLNIIKKTESEKIKL